VTSRTARLRCFQPKILNPDRRRASPDSAALDFFFCAGAPAPLDQFFNLMIILADGSTESPPRCGQSFVLYLSAVGKFCILEEVTVSGSLAFLHLPTFTSERDAPSSPFFTMFLEDFQLAEDGGLFTNFCKSCVPSQAKRAAFAESHFLDHLAPPPRSEGQELPWFFFFFILAL